MSRITSAVLFWVFFVASPVLTTGAALRYGDVGTLDFLLVIATAGLAVAWYKADASAEGFSTPVSLDLFVLFAAALAVPYYLLKYRGWRRGAVTLAKVIAIGALVVGLSASIEAAVLHAYGV